MVQRSCIRTGIESGTRTEPESRNLLEDVGIRSNLDDKARENIIRVMDMWVTLNDKRVTALVADGVECLTFTNDIDFITRPVQEPVPSKGPINIIHVKRTLTNRSEQD